MSVDTLDDPFVEGLQQLYYTEQQLVEAREELENGSVEDEIKSQYITKPVS